MWTFIYFCFISNIPNSPQKHAEIFVRQETNGAVNNMPIVSAYKYTETERGKIITNFTLLTIQSMKKNRCNKIPPSRALASRLKIENLTTFPFYAWNGETY